MELEVIHRQGDETRRLRFAPGKVTVGRRSACDIVLEPRDVAPLHALASWQHDRWVLIAAAKDAALEVAGRRLKSVVLRGVTQVQIGSARVTFVVRADAASPSAGDAPAGDTPTAGTRGDFDTLLGATRGGAAAEERDITALCVRIDGQLASDCRLSPARRQRLLDMVLTVLAEAVAHEAGTLDAGVGERVSAFFGAPVHHEDDALRAVRAALAMQARLAELRAARPELAAVSLRIGAATGAALVGELGAPSGRSYTALGAAPAAAERLAALARGGQVVVDVTTQQRMAGAVRPVAVDRGDGAFVIEGLQAAASPEPR